MRRSTSPCVISRLGAIESISSAWHSSAQVHQATCCGASMKMRAGSGRAKRAPRRTDEDDGGCVLLSLLERLAQVGLALASQLGHDFGAVDEEEEGAGLVGHGARDERLARARRAVQQDALGRLDADRLEQLRVAQRQLHLAARGDARQRPRKQGTARGGRALRSAAPARGSAPSACARRRCRRSQPGGAKAGARVGECGEAATATAWREG